MEKKTLIKKLNMLGFIDPKPSKNELDYGIEKYQDFHNLEPGQSILERHLELPRFCGFPDRMNLNATICKWPTVNVTISMIQEIRGLTLDQCKNALTEAALRWKSVCAINPSYLDNAAQANIQAGSRNIDAPQGVLAESELPCGTRRSIKQWYDNYEDWVIGKPTSRAGINIIAVMCHELGHAFGLEHSNDGGLMDPFYSPDVDAPRGDMERRWMVQRYGPPGLIPIPPSTPPINPDMSKIIKILNCIKENL